MKKILALLMMVVMLCALLTGCGDPLYDDIENFLNVEMAEVNDNYSTITKEVSGWAALENDAVLAENIEIIIMPLVDESLALLAEINPKTQEVKIIKDKYVKVMETYKKAFEIIAEGCITQDEETILEGTAGLEEAVDLLDEYNKAVEEFALAHGGEVEY